MQPIIKRALEEIGLSDKESAVLLTLLERGPMLASAIGKAAKLNRTTVYSVLKELSAQGLVSSAKREGATRYQSIAPDLLPSFVERRREALAETKKVLEEHVPQIKLLRAKGKQLPKVQFFEGQEGVEQAYEDTLVNNKGKTLYEITGIDAVYTKLDPRFVQYYLNKRTKLGIKSIYLTPETKGALEAQKDDKRYLREAKFIPPQYTMDTEIAIYDNKVGIFSYALENPVAIIIEDDTISHTMKTLFDYMESTAE